jgi:hypothetical protein
MFSKWTVISRSTALTRVYAPAQLLPAKYLHKAPGPAVYLIAFPQGSLFFYYYFNKDDKQKKLKRNRFLQARRE